MTAAAKAGADEPVAAWRPRGALARHLALDTPLATGIYWVALFGYALALFIPELLPMVDYPQHVAMAEMAHRMADPAHPLNEGFSLNYFTYNGLFQWLVAQMAAVMPAETAGRIVVGLSIVGLGGATLALLRTLDRPPVYAALFVPALFASPLAWGFTNYALSIFLGAVALVFICRTLKRPQWQGPLLVAALGMLSGFTHVLGTLLLCVLGLAFSPEVAWRATEGPTGRRLLSALGRMVLALAPLLLGSAYCIAVYLEQYSWNPAVYTDPTMEGTGPGLLHRLVWFTAYATGLHYDASDQIVLGCAILTGFFAVGLGIYARRRGATGDHPLVLPFVAGLGIYLFIPMVFIGTHIIFPRFGQTAIFGLLFLLPRVTGEVGVAWQPRLRRVALGLAGLAALNFVVHMKLFADETDGLSRVIDEVPKGRRVTAVIHQPSTYAFRGGVLIHAAAYYGARTGGEYAFNFARYASVPLNFRPGTQPAWPQKGWEFFPQDYNPSCGYARYYDVVILRAPEELADAPDADLAALVFGDDAGRVTPLAREGRYAAFDSEGIPPDGTY